MTTRRKRPHPARSARRTVGAASVAGMFVLTGAMAGHAIQSSSASKSSTAAGASAAATTSATDDDVSSLITSATPAQSTTSSVSAQTSSHGS